MPQDKTYSNDYASDVAELMVNGNKGDERSQGAINELYQRAQSDPRILNVMKDAANRLNDNRHIPMKKKDGPIWPRLAELRGEPKAESNEPSEREAGLLRIIKNLMAEQGGEPTESPSSIG